MKKTKCPRFGGNCTGKDCWDADRCKEGLMKGQTKIGEIKNE
jgi:hypothetical protein